MPSRPSLDVVDRGTVLSFTFDDLMRHHGPGSPGGVAIAFKVLELGLPLLGSGAPPARRELARPARGRVLERFVFALEHRGVTATLLLRDGFVDEEFADLAGTQARTASQEARLDVLKRELAERVLAAPAAEVLEVETYRATA